MIRVKNPNYIDRLSNEYQEVEYLESTGNQWIDTGVPAFSKTRSEIDVEFTHMTGQGDYSFYNGHVRETKLASISHAFGSYYSGATYLTTLEWDTIYDGTRGWDYDYERHVLFLDGKTGEYGLLDGSFTGSGLIEDTEYLEGEYLYLFACNQYDRYGDWVGATYKTYEKVYGAKYYLDGVLVRDFIPCVRKSDNKPGMYDLINNQFYINQGTEEFLVGKDVNKKDINIKPKIGDKILLKRYIGNFLIYLAPGYIDFKSCPFPTVWTERASALQYYATNEYGNWIISTDNFADTTHTINKGYDQNIDNYHTSKALSTSSLTEITYINCPKLICPTYIYIKYKCAKEAILQGFDIDTNSWITLYSLPDSSSNSIITEKNVELSNKKYYSAFRIMGKAYASGNTYFYLYDFQIQKGSMKELKIINFTINNVVYQADNGMTWEEWVNSEYNIGNWYILNNFIYVDNSDGSMTHILDSSSPYNEVESNEIIIANKFYPTIKEK